MDKMREEFEDWCKRDLGFTPEWISEYDCYSFVGTNDMWLSWQASRAALCVELNSVVFSSDKNGEGGLMLHERVLKAMSDAGVSYK